MKDEKKVGLLIGFYLVATCFVFLITNVYAMGAKKQIEIKLKRVETKDGVTTMDLVLENKGELLDTTQFKLVVKGKEERIFMELYIGEVLGEKETKEVRLTLGQPLPEAYTVTYQLAGTVYDK